jgi:replicative DNA helicase
VIVVGARPSIGKTAIALTITRHAAIKLAKKVLYFSVETPKEQMVQRLLCAEARVDSCRLRSGFMPRSEFPRIRRAAQTLVDAPIYMDDTASISISTLRSKAHRHAEKHGVDLIVVDYVQLITGVDFADTRYWEVSEISRFLKCIARELNCPIIVLSQMSREAEKDGSGGPKLTHLRDSGALEEDADVVLLLSKTPEYANEGLNNLIRIHIAKQRMGPSGHVDMVFDKNLQEFREQPQTKVDSEDPLEVDDGPF